ncbi:MAG: hypothetical protein GY820_31045 [Gammaproteobacteria bacterium]|nr:hypothetical protein [Gammaproteobacteria bacterium]
MLNIKNDLNGKRSQLKNEFKEVENKIKEYYKEKDGFNQRMEVIQKEKMVYIEKCNELLDKNEELIKKFDNNERIKDLNSSSNYSLQMDKEEIQAHRLKVHELSEKEDGEINEMNKKTKSINRVKENYDRKYRSLKNDLTKLEEDYDTYIENSEAIEYQIDDLNYHDKESLTNKRSAIYEERQRKIAKNREEASFKAPSLKDKFYHSMYNTLEKT